MKKIIIIVLVALISASCNTEIKKQLKSDIEKTQIELERLRTEYSEICSQIPEHQAMVKHLADSIEVLDSITLQLDSTIMELNQTLNPKSKPGSNVIVFGSGRGPNQAILNDPRFKF